MRIVAQAVDVEIGGRFLAADEHLVAVAFAAFHADAGDVAQRIVELADRLVLQLVLGNEADALGHVDQRGRGLGSGRSVLIAVAVAFAAHDDLRGEIAALRLGFGGTALGRFGEGR